MEKKLWDKRLCKFGWNRRSGSGEEDFLFDFVNVFSLCRHYLTLEKGGALHLKKIESLHQMMPCAKLVEIGKVVLETKMKMWKVYDNAKDNDDNDDDDGHILTNKTLAHVNLKEKY